MAEKNFELVVDQSDDESLPTFELPAEELEVSPEGYSYSLRWKDAT